MYSLRDQSHVRDTCFLKQITQNAEASSTRTARPLQRFNWKSSERDEFTARELEVGCLRRMLDKRPSAYRLQAQQGGAKCDAWSP